MGVGWGGGGGEKREMLDSEIQFHQEADSRSDFNFFKFLYLVLFMSKADFWLVCGKYIYTRHHIQTNIALILNWYNVSGANFYLGRCD